MVSEAKKTAGIPECVPLDALVRIQRQVQKIAVATVVNAHKSHYTIVIIILSDTLSLFFYCHAVVIVKLRFFRDRD